MGLTIAQKIIKEHLVSGEMRVGEEIALRPEPRHKQNLPVPV